MIAGRLTEALEPIREIVQDPGRHRTAATVFEAISVKVVFPHAEVKNCRPREDSKAFEDCPELPHLIPTMKAHQFRR